MKKNVSERVLDLIGDNLVLLTKHIDKRDPESVAHGCLGGEHGYGAHWSNGVFTMRPLYWGDCDCGADERSDKWHAANPHAVDCFREELQRRFAKYDQESGYAAADKAAFGDDGIDFFAGMDVEVEEPMEGVRIITMEPRRDGTMEAWRKASDARQKEHAKLTRELYLERGIKPSDYQWHCTCGVDKKAEAYFASESHYPTCALELPNFLHKPSGMEVRWYKYIGRSMEVKNVPKDIAALNAIFSECLASV
jgi:hypothetical protein